MSTPGDIRRRTLLRAVNERIFEISRSLDRFEVLCECGAAGCFSQIEISPLEYRSIRDNGGPSLMAPGHEAEIPARAI